METTHTRPPTSLQRLQLLLAQVWRDDARPLRFAITGGTAGLMQLVLLALFTDVGWHAALANIVAYLIAAQVNFAFSTLFTWHDRREAAHGSVRQRWLRFHGSIAGTFALNQLMFLIARQALPTLAASALGILGAALVNYLVFDRVVFRAPPEIVRQLRDEPLE